jgi:hypothetical protein
MAKSFALINFRQKEEEIDYILNEVMYRHNQSKVIKVCLKDAFVSICNIKIRLATSFRYSLCLEIP